MENVLEQKKAAKRKRLLDAAYTLFQEKGAANTTINDIAKEAQVAKGTFYLYFRDKTEILDAWSCRFATRSFATPASTWLRRIPPAWRIGWSAWWITF